MKSIRFFLLGLIAMLAIGAAPLAAAGADMGTIGESYEKDGTTWQPIFMSFDGARVECEMPGSPTEQKVKGLKGLGSTEDGVWFYLLRVPRVLYTKPASYDDFREQVKGLIAGNGTLTDAGYPGRGLKYAIQIVGANGGDEHSDVFWVMLTDHDCYIFGALAEDDSANLSLIPVGLDTFLSVN